MDETAHKKVHIDMDFILGAERSTDIMEWLRREIKAQYGENAIISEIHNSGDFDFEGDSYKIDVTVRIPSPMKVEEEMTPEQWRESYAHYLAQSETLTVTEIHFDADKIDPESLEWALAETKRVFGNRVIVEVFRSEN